MGEELKKKLLRNQKTGWEEISEEEKNKKSKKFQNHIWTF